MEQNGAVERSSQALKLRAPQLGESARPRRPSAFLGQAALGGGTRHCLSSPLVLAVPGIKPGSSALLRWRDLMKVDPLVGPRRLRASGSKHSSAAYLATSVSEGIAWAARRRPSSHGVGSWQQALAGASGPAKVQASTSALLLASFRASTKQLAPASAPSPPASLRATTRPSRYHHSASALPALGLHSASAAPALGLRGTTNQPPPA